MVCKCARCAVIVRAIDLGYHFVVMEILKCSKNCKLIY